MTGHTFRPDGYAQFGALTSILAKKTNNIFFSHFDTKKSQIITVIHVVDQRSAADHMDHTLQFKECRIELTIIR